MFVKKKVFCGFLALSLFANTFSGLPSHAGLLDWGKTALDIGRSIFGGNKQPEQSGGDTSNSDENNNNQGGEGSDRLNPRQQTSNNNNQQQNNQYPVYTVNTSRLDPSPTTGNSSFTPQLNKQDKPLNVYMPLPTTPQLNKQDKPLNVYMPLPDPQQQLGQSQGGYLNNDGLPRQSDPIITGNPFTPNLNKPVKPIPNIQIPQIVPNGGQVGSVPNVPGNPLYPQPIPNIQIPQIIPNGGQVGSVPSQTNASPYQLGQLIGGQAGTGIASNPSNPFMVSSNGQLPSLSYNPNVQFSPYSEQIPSSVQNVLGLPQGVSGGSSNYSLSNPIIQECLNRAASGMYNNRTCFLLNSPAEKIVEDYLKATGKPYPTVLAAQQQQQDLKAATEKACANGEAICNYVKGQISASAGCDKPENKDNPACQEMANSGLTLTQPATECKAGGAWNAETEMNCKVGIAKGVTFESLSDADKAKLVTIFGKDPSATIGSIAGSFNTNIGNINGIANQVNGALGFINNPLDSTKNFLLGNVGIVLGRVLSELGVSPTIANIVANIGQNIASGGGIGRSILLGGLSGLGGFGGIANGIIGNRIGDNNNINNGGIINNIGPINQGVGGVYYDPNQIISSANGLPVAGGGVPNNVYGPPAPGIVSAQPVNPSIPNTTIGTAFSQRVYPNGTIETTEIGEDGSRVITTTTGDHKNIVALPPHPAQNAFEVKNLGNGATMTINKLTGATVSVANPKKDFSQLNRAQGSAPPPKAR